jgi:hypothetical protein
MNQPNDEKGQIELVQVSFECQVSGPKIMHKLLFRGGPCFLNQSMVFSLFKSVGSDHPDTEVYNSGLLAWGDGMKYMQAVRCIFQ